MRCTWIWTGLIPAALACLACGGEPTGSGGDSNAEPAARSASVSIEDFTFGPSNVTIRVGGEVVWTNVGPSEHTATSDAAMWDSGTLTAPAGYDDDGGGGGGGTSYDVAAADEFYVRTFYEPGTYQYHCSFHPSMQGTIVVSE